MLKNEGTHSIGVALGTDRELSGSGANLVSGLSTVGIVTVTALDQSDVDTVTVGPGKLGFLGRVAAEAQVRLRLHQHEIHICGLVRAVAGSATEAVRHVLRLREVLRFQTGLVTLRTDCCRLSGTQGFEPNDLGDITTAVDVRLSGTVTSLAPVLIPLQ
jgi:hypothetical protein